MRKSNDIKTSRPTKTESVTKKKSPAKPVRKNEPAKPRGYDYEFGVELGPKATRGTAATGKKKTTQTKAKTKTTKSGTKKASR